MHESFVGEKITAGFFHNNRLGFLSKDNVSMSQSGSYYNFYFETAQTIIDSDPIDISCSSIRPTALHAVIPTAQGVVLFSENQQFVMFSDSGVLTPTLTTIRTLSKLGKADLNSLTQLCLSFLSCTLLTIIFFSYLCA